MRNLKQNSRGLLISIVCVLVLLTLFSCNFYDTFEKQIEKNFIEQKVQNLPVTVAVYQVREEGKNYESNVSLFWKTQIKKI